MRLGLLLLPATLLLQTLLHLWDRLPLPTVFSGRRVTGSWTFCSRTLATCLKVAAAADAAGVSTILHGGGNSAFGQHFSYATPSVPWCEHFVGTAPGVPLEEGSRPPGPVVPQDGYLAPSDAPGFGLEISEEWLVPFFRQ